MLRNTRRRLPEQRLDRLPVHLRLRPELGARVIEQAGEAVVVRFAGELHQPGVGQRLPEIEQVRRVALRLHQQRPGQAVGDPERLLALGVPPDHVQDQPRRREVAVAGDLQEDLAVQGVVESRSLQLPRRERPRRAPLLRGAQAERLVGEEKGDNQGHGASFKRQPRISMDQAGRPLTSAMSRLAMLAGVWSGTTWTGC